MSKNIEIYTQTDPEDTFIDVPGTASAITGKPRQMQIYAGSGDTRVPGTNGYTAPADDAASNDSDDDDFDLTAIASRVGKSKLTIFEPRGGDAA
ncbi:hypothetical protein AN948_32795 [Rhodococcus sp. ADH]|uniref:hypothetical protein n=1 Tax=unclassified Rhodococcus (in: high G+C Gram-positive bacteria) TaxID=192944 RepID=UPI0006BA5893|nr:MULTISPECIES: hypothetical protein [unclassified Rhodococcus (in: high G+C Gram-positive bacteria)]KPH15900.1 hypothetical protein AN948_32795 [Rhodococcus sp. ADH]